MRTACSLLYGGGLYPGRLCLGGGGVIVQEVSVQGVSVGGVSVQVGVSIRETPWKETPSPLWTE